MKKQEKSLTGLWTKGVAAVCTGLAVVLLLWMVDFRVVDLFHPKIFISMLGSIGLLTVVAYRNKGTDFVQVFGFQTAMVSVFALLLLYGYRFFDCLVYVAC